MQNTAFVGGDHVLDVDEGIFPTGLFQKFKGLSDEVAKVESFALIVLDLITNVFVGVAEDVEDGEDLSVVGYQSLPDHVATQHQFLDHLQHHGDDVGVTGVESSCVTGAVLLMGMMSCGMTGRILLPPLSSRSQAPMMAKERQGSIFSWQPSKKMGRQWWQSRLSAETFQTSLGMELWWSMRMGRSPRSQYRRNSEAGTSLRSKAPLLGGGGWKVRFFSRVEEVRPPVPLNRSFFSSEPDMVSSQLGSWFFSSIFSLGMQLAGKSPNGECGFLGANLFFQGLQDQLLDRLMMFLSWSSAVQRIWVLWMREAGLSLRRFWASDDCWSFGSIGKVQLIILVALLLCGVYGGSIYTIVMLPINCRHYIWGNNNRWVITQPTNYLCYNQLQMIHCISKVKTKTTLKSIPQLQSPNKIVKISYPHHSIQLVSAYLTKAINTQELNLSYNLIAMIEPILKLKNLRILHLSNNLIECIPRNIVNLAKLQLIDLSYNLLSTLTNISPLFVLYKNSKATLSIKLEGNQVVKEFGGEIQQKLGDIDEQVQLIKTQLMGNYPEGKLIEKGKSISIGQLHQPNSHQPEQPSSNKNNQTIKTKPAIPVSSLEQARKTIEKYADCLTQFQRKFDLLSSTSFSGWDNQLVTAFQKQGQTVRQFIEVHQQLIPMLTSDLGSPSHATRKLDSALSRALELKEQVKQQHSAFLQSLGACEAPIKIYQIWVQFYRELRVATEHIKRLAEDIIRCQIRNQRIETLKLISPQKSTIGDQQGCYDQLGCFLFSDTKQGENQENANQECGDCFIKGEELHKLKQTIQQITQQNCQLKLSNQSLTTANQSLTKSNEILSKQLTAKQQIIIDSLHQKITASVYQKVLLEQARGIQDLIKCDRHQLARDKRHSSKLDLLYRAVFPNSKDNEHARQNVSELPMYPPKKEVTTVMVKRPYFNQYEHSEANGAHWNQKYKTKGSMVSTEKKKIIGKLENGRQRSHSSAISSKERTNILSSMRISNKSQLSSSKPIPTRVITHQSNNQKQQQVTQNVVTSDFLLTENDQYRQNQQPLNNTELPIADVKGRKDERAEANSNKGCLKNSAQKENYEPNSNRQEEHKNNTISEKYSGMQYRSIPLKHEQSYDNFIRYHLRNTIINTLAKTGTHCNLERTKKHHEGTVKLKLNKNGSNKQVFCKYSIQIPSEGQNKLQKQRIEFSKFKNISKSCTLTAEKKEQGG